MHAVRPPHWCVWRRGQAGRRRPCVHDGRIAAYPPAWNHPHRMKFARCTYAGTGQNALLAQGAMTPAHHSGEDNSTLSGVATSSRIRSRGTCSSTTIPQGGRTLRCFVWEIGTEAPGSCATRDVAQGVRQVRASRLMVWPSADDAHPLPQHRRENGRPVTVEALYECRVALPAASSSSR